MAEVQKMRGEKIYECDFNITGVTDYGVTLDALLSGKEKVPLQGARVDVAFEGDIKGRITGKVRNGVEYLQLRADGRTDLDSRATVETEDGDRIAATRPDRIRARRRREDFDRQRSRCACPAPRLVPERRSGSSLAPRCRRASSARRRPWSAPGWGP